MQVEKRQDAALRGTQRVYTFDNGYGASVIRNDFSYGGRDGLYELAVLGLSGAITYETPITEDVLGWLTPLDVRAILRDIQALPRQED